MFGWVLKRGFETATGATADATDDTTQIEQPDTPAPVFAARAFKSALFGTPAPPADHARGQVSNNMVQQKRKSQEADTAEFNPRSPTKPQGILLTPGIGSARRKRVSFGHDVKDMALTRDAQEKGIADCPGRDLSHWGDGGQGVQSRPRTKLAEALERSRKHKTKPESPSVKKLQTETKQANAADDEWEEEEDECDGDPDMTVDLNEPHSRSGKYWKSEFEKYHEDAKSEMEKLVKYKQLAKSYAKMKDAESLDLNQKLKEEQEKVALMEKRVTKRAASMATKRAKGTEDNDDPDMMRSLARQTALAVQYRNQVRELEALLKDKQDEVTTASGRGRRAATSPRTQKTLLETQRELRRAREQVKEIGSLREEVGTLQSDLLFAEQRSSKLVDENKRLAKDLEKQVSRVAELESQLKRYVTESGQKDKEVRRLKDEYHLLKENAKSRQGEAEHVLKRKNDKISDLRRELRAGKEAEPKPADRDDPKRQEEAQAELVKPRKTTQDWALDAAQEAQVDNANAKMPKMHRHKSQPLLSHAHASEAGGRPSHVMRTEPASQNGGGMPSIPQVDEAAQPRRSQHARQTSAAILSNVQNDVARVDKGWRPGNWYRHSDLRRDGDGNPLADRRGGKEADTARPTSSDSEVPKIDLVQGRFTRLGAPEINSSGVWTSTTTRSALPPERRAAALARLKQRKAERVKGHSRVLDKENVRP